MTFGERLTNLRKEHGYKSRNDFAIKLGIPSTTLRNYETDAREPGHTFLKQISEFFNVSVDYLLCLTDEKEVLHTFRLRSSEQDIIEKYRTLDTHGKDMVNMVLKKEAERMKKLEDKPTSNVTPMRIMSYYQRMASAGSGEYLFDDIPTDLIEVEDTPLSRKADFVLGVNGHSMEPTYYDGDNVLVRKTSDVPIGHIGIFIKGSNCYIKELGEDRLISHNEDKDTYPDIYPDDEPIGVVGEVLGKV